MAESYIWGNLNRSVTDSTLIDEAIDEAITAHNDNPDAHFGPDGALESHRMAEVIDHRAESVVNDKLAKSSRLYMAIVDPSSEHDFDSIESAVAYTKENGGGNILITRGTHYVSSAIEVPLNINLVGIDMDNCIISIDDDGESCLSFVDPPNSSYEGGELKNLLLRTNGGRGLLFEYGAISTMNGVSLNGCIIEARPTLAEGSITSFSIKDCLLKISNDYAIKCDGMIYISDSVIMNISGQNSRKLITGNEDLGIGFDLDMRNVIMNPITGLNSLSIDANSCESLRAYNSTLAGIGAWNMNTGVTELNACGLNFNSTGYISIGYNNAQITNCRNGLGGNGRIRIKSGIRNCIICNNTLGGTVTNAGTNNIVANNTTTI